MLTCSDTYSLLAFAHLTMRLLRASCPPIVQAGILWQDFEPQCWQALDSKEIASVSASIRKPNRGSAKLTLLHVGETTQISGCGLRPAAGSHHCGSSNPSRKYGPGSSCFLHGISMTSSGPSVYARVEVSIRPMMKIEALIHPFKLEEVNGILQDLDCEEVTISEVLHRGGPNIQKTVYRGCEYRVDVPRVKVEMLVSSLRVDEVLEAL